eukprot:TRINITY_DN8402_c0_g1_i2.p2 TRINITY_DN8402_c0_g1~~TRINITY_DN8402_c0_g1_i2.p2  ORF type:complete len:109 (-),score=31.45 TRINITY_DN8402_c0_g1_i2:15-341(-)
MIRRPPRSTHCISSAASDVYKRQVQQLQQTLQSLEVKQGQLQSEMRFTQTNNQQETMLNYNLSLIHISEPTRLGMISYAVFCLKKKKKPPITSTEYVYIQLTKRAIRD